MTSLVNYRVIWLKLNLHLLPYIKSFCSRLIAGILAATAFLMADFSGAVIAAAKPKYRGLTHSISRYQMLQIASLAAHRSSGNLLAIALLGIILAAIPLNLPWVFRMVLVSAFVLGYFANETPTFQLAHHSTIISLTADHKLTSYLNKNYQVIPLIFLAIFLFSFIFLSLSHHVIFSQPINKKRRIDIGNVLVLSVGRRLAAAIASTAMLSAAFYLALMMRAAIARSELNVDHAYIRNAFLWLLALIVVSLASCFGGARGHINLLTAALCAIPALIILPHMLNILMPSTIRIYNAFWIAVWGYLIVASLGLTCVASILWRPAQD